MYIFFETLNKIILTGDLVVDYLNPNDPARYRYEWNKGDQPWCRSREMDNFLKYLIAILSVIFLLMV